MSKITYTATKVECDRCKTHEDTSSSEGRNEWGETLMKYHGHQGGRGYDGSAGGCDHKGDVWLCLKCTRDFLEFMRGVSK